MNKSIWILFAIITVEINKQNIIEQNMLKYIFRNPENLFLIIYRNKHWKKKKKRKRISDDSSLVKKRWLAWYING